MIPNRKPPNYCILIAFILIATLLSCSIYAQPARRELRSTNLDALLLRGGPIPNTRDTDTDKSLSRISDSNITSRSNKDPEISQDKPLLLPKTPSESVTPTTRTTLPRPPEPHTSTYSTRDSTTISRRINDNHDNTTIREGSHFLGRRQPRHFIPMDTRESNINYSHDDDNNYGNTDDYNDNNIDPSSSYYLNRQRFKELGSSIGHVRRIIGQLSNPKTRVMYLDNKIWDDMDDLDIIRDNADNNNNNIHDTTMTIIPRMVTLSDDIILVQRNIPLHVVNPGLKPRRPPRNVPPSSSSSSTESSSADTPLVEPIEMTSSERLDFRSSMVKLLNSLIQEQRKQHRLSIIRGYREHDNNNNNDMVDNTTQPSTHDTKILEKMLDKRNKISENSNNDQPRIIRSVIRTPGENLTLVVEQSTTIPESSTNSNDSTSRNRHDTLTPAQRLAYDVIQRRRETRQWLRAQAQPRPRWVHPR